MPAQPDPELWVTVVRSGGFAGLVRRWSVEPEPDRAPVWEQLILACPWDHAAAPSAQDAPPAGADRFQWEVCASRRGDTRRAALPDQQLTGPWRELVDAVREADTDASAAVAPEH